jgi:hypothetical protein
MNAVEVVVTIRSEHPSFYTETVSISEELYSAFRGESETHGNLPS